MQTKDEILKDIDVVTAEIDALTLEVNAAMNNIESSNRTELRKKILVLTGIRRKLNEELVFAEQSGVSKSVIVFVTIIITAFVLMAGFLFLGN